MRSIDSTKRALACTGILACLASAGACRTVGQPGSSTPGASDTLGGGGRPTSENRLDLGGGATRPIAGSATSAPSSSASATTPPRWSNPVEREGESASAGLYTMLDGACGHLSVSLFQNEAIAMFGSALARVTDDGLSVDPTLNKGYEGGAYAAVGRWPDSAYLLYDNGTRCTSSVRAKHFQNGKWEEAFALPQEHSVKNVALFGNGAIGLRECSWSCGDGGGDCGAGMYIGDNAKAPPIAGDGFRTTSYEVLPTGEVYAVGVVCPKNDKDAKCAGQLRWWSPGAKVGYLPLGGGLDGPQAVQDAHGWLVVKSKNEAYISQGSYFGSFDGAKLTKLPPPSKARTLRVFDAKGEGLWVETEDKVYARKPDGTYTDVTPPKFTALGALAGVSVGSPWYMTGDRYPSWTQPRDLYRRVDGSWQKVDLPRPARASSTKSYLTPESVTVRAADDVFVVATYHEMPAGWQEAERRRVLLRTKRPKETMRCSGSNGVEAWPPPALDTCTTPFVVFAEVSAASPKDYDYPQTRGLLRGKTSMIVDGSLAEIRENGKIWIGAVPKTVADGRKLVERYAKVWVSAKPEVVCTTPNITRKVPIEK